MDEMSDSTPETSRGRSGGTPLWVKVFGAIFAVLVVIFVAGLLIGGGHGPGRHQTSQDPVPTQATAPAGSQE